MKDNSSIHNLNADKNLGMFGKALWMLVNFMNNNYVPNRSGDLSIKDFSPELDEKDWEKIAVESSPSRALSDLFWLKLDWKAIKSELGNINVFDTGAGRGEYALRLNEFAGGIDAYMGVDFSSRKEWDEIIRDNEFISMKQHNSSTITDVVPHGTNFFMSQSAIEHFENDLLFFEQIRDFIDSKRQNTIQVHLFPSAACLKLYLWHGVRQYTPRTVQLIAQLFDSANTYSTLFRLGGGNCNKLHYRFITRPLITERVDWRDSKTEEYRDHHEVAVK
jgi:hypothetical protein